VRVVPQQFEIVSIDSVRPHPRNPRASDTGIIRESIDVNGWYGALVVQESTGFILAGSHRHKAALQQGATTIPVIRVSVNDDEALRIMLADNRTSDLADYDEELLTQLLAELSMESLGLQGTGFDENSLDNMLDDLSGVEAGEAAPDQTDELVDKFEIVVSCPSEEEQRKLLDRLMAEGLACRALVS